MVQILIVEDDYRIANIHEKFLEEVQDIHVIGKALNGKEALDIFSKKTVDLILLDLYLPDMQGIELITAFKKVNSDIDIIVISAAVEKDMIKDALRSGVYYFMIKPAKKDKFIQVIHQYIEMKKQFDLIPVIEQSFLDMYFGLSNVKTEWNVENTPKGIDPLTLKKVKEMIQQMKRGITAEEMGDKVGVSRTTARRYLEYLISKKEIFADLEYGEVGRPERKYFVIH
ncbi:response regulator [Cerasibacillus terrae]|uniref:Response regulator n=1 Tax=Cerasibacillus terrae TaxID=2498845 RepID=A0A5C8NV42_9BACI|nr:response regulator [Cerasibacillus terrae]TXL65041.1 response regulator [Cerasibacillus terrae]